MEARVYENEDIDIDMDDVAALLVRLYADYYYGRGGFENDNSKAYAKAVGIAIRMLSDYE